MFRTDHRYQFCQLNVLNHLLRLEMICKFHLNVRIQQEYLSLVQIHDYRDQLQKRLDGDLYEEKESIFTVSSMYRNTGKLLLIQYFRLNDQENV